MIVLVWLLFGVITGVVANNKGHPAGPWTLYGILLGPFALVQTFAVRANASQIESQEIATGAMRKCPFGAELVKADAIVCRYCQRDLPAHRPASMHTAPREFRGDVASQDIAARRTGAIALIVFVLLAIGVLAFVRQSRPRVDPAVEAQNALDACTQRGETFFKSVAAETWPKLGDGRDGHSVAVERCQQSPNAF